MRQAFRAWLEKNGYKENTINTYINSINPISNHCGQEVYEITEIAEMERLVQLYGTGGTYPEINGANSNNVRSAIGKLRDFLKEKLSDGKAASAFGGQMQVMEATNFLSDMAKEAPLNQILFGPPGTGKTYNTINKALEILAPEFLQQNADNRAALKDKFDEMVKAERVRFVTFHQSFSYEDFVEGIRAVTDENDESEAKGIQYRVEKGVFRQICEKASTNSEQNEKLGIRDNARVWKIAIGEADGEQDTRQYCFDNNQARIGWDHVGDLREANLNNPNFNLGSNDRSSVEQFSHNMVVGDVVLCFKRVDTISAVGVVTGDYYFDQSPPTKVRKDYKNVLPVNWLLKNINFNILPLNKGVRLTLKTVYPLWRINWPRLQEALVEAGHQLLQQTASPSGQDCVLIIDEINRGNISRIFGELITLLEPSKRKGEEEELRVTLPYSRDEFGIPKNLYLIGTMNTADRSLTALDIALRRRFEFVEMPPKPALLNDVSVDGLNMGKLLETINKRIEVLLGADFCIGHAYFMPLKEAPSLTFLGRIFDKQIIPLLQEYFFDDWQRIAWVLNDHRKEEALQIVCKIQEGHDAVSLFGHIEGLTELPPRWRINPNALRNIDSFKAILG